MVKGPNRMGSNTRILLQGLAFPEAPRWRRDRLWFTDQHARRVMTVTLEGRTESLLETDDSPGGLGWLPDGTPLVVGMCDRAVYRITDQGLALHADLTAIAAFHCNDMVVDGQGRAYVGNFGYDLHAGAPVSPACLALIEPDGASRTAANDLVFANGCVISPDGSNFIVAETFANRLSAFDISGNGDLSNRRVWADLGDATPDGICLDAEGAIWVASPATGEVIRVREGGAVLFRIMPIGTPYACMLGGPDRTILFVLTSETDDPGRAHLLKSGRIEIVHVQTPGAGLP